MALPTPPFVIEGPLPLPPTDGLRGAALDANSAQVSLNPRDPLDPTGEGWLRGFTFSRYPCGGGAIRDICDHTTVKSASTTLGVRQVQPYPVVVGRTCSTYGWNDPHRDLVRDATLLLEAFQYELIARELWRGDLARASSYPNPYLARSGEADFVNLSPGAGDIFSPIDGLAAMEDALAACTPGPRLIHAPRGLLIYWDAGGALRYEGGRVYTIMGTQIIADSGYDGSGPDSTNNVAPTSAGWWVYGSGPIAVRLEKTVQITPPPAMVDQAINKVENTVTYFAERRAAVSWNCCSIAMQVAP